MIRAFLIIALIGSCTTVFSQLSGYNYYNILSIQASQVAGGSSHLDFPVLIQHTDPDLATTANGGYVENPNGWDIRFTAVDGVTLLDQQIESYDPITGAIVFWVRIPTLSNSVNTNIRMYYGNGSIVSDPSSNAVWDANFQGVWHLDNSNDGATNFTNHLVTNNGSINEANSIIADGQQFSTGDYLSSGVESELQIDGDVTVESWVNFNSLQGGTGDNSIISCGLPGLTAPENHMYKLNVTGLNLLRAYWEYGSGIAESVISTIGAPISTSTWHHVAFTRDVSTNTVVFYFDGSQLGLPVVYVNDPSDGASGVLSLGENFPGLDLDGSIDEPRISNVIRSSDWLQTSYNSMSDPSSFYTISSRMSTAPDWCWAEDALAGNNEAFLDLATDPGSGVSYAVGYFNDDISLEFPTGVNNTPDMSVLLGNQDGLVAKYDLNGNPIWAFKIGAPGQVVWCTGIEIGNGGNIFVTGYFNDQCEFQGVTGSPTSLLTALSQGGTNEEAFIASYDSDGNLRWVRQGSNIGEAMTNDIATNTTMVYVIGWFENSISFTGAPSITSNDNRDAFIVAYDQSTGAYQWISRAGDVSGSNLDDYGVAIAADDNEIYISGEHSGIIQFNGGPIQVNAPTPGKNNIWLAELDAASGNTNWANYIGGTDDCEANAIVINANDIFITGGIKGDVDFPGIGTITVPGADNEIFICSIKRTTQATLWYDISENDDGNPVFGEDIILDNVGNVYYTGIMRGVTDFNNGLDPINHIGGDDIFVSSYTVSGTYNWTQIATDNSNIVSNGIGCDDDGGVYIAGMMDSQASFGSLPTLADAGGNDAFIAKISCSNPCAGPTITVCPPDLTVTADPTCNHTIGSYLGATTATDDCGTGSVTITQSPAPFTVLAAGQHTITMTATDGNGDTDVCSWVLTIEADVNPVVAECGDTYLAQTTIGQGDNGNAFSCYGSATNGEDVYYQITVPSGNYLLGITLSNVTDNESQINTFWIGPGCPLGVTCLEENRYVVGAQKFISNNQNQLLFNAAGPGTYYFVVDSELDGVTQYDIAFDCIVSGVEFDESGCPPDTDNDGIYSTINGLPTLDLTPCQTGVQVCNSIFVQNVMAGEWIDTVEMTLGPCYTNVTNFSPDAPGPNGFYDGAGTWSATFDGPSNSIQWAFDYSGAQDLGDGTGSNYNCLNYDFCFTADITPGCNLASDLDVSIHIEDDGVNGLTPGVSNGFDDAVARFNLVDPPPTVSCPANVNISVDPSACSAIVNSISPAASNDNCPSPAITYVLTGATTGSGSNDASGETFNLGTTTVTYTITDGAGNTNTCAFTVTVSDNEAPTITCPANVNVNNDLGVCTAAVTGIAPTSVGDNCTVASVTYTLSGATTGAGTIDASGETFNLGTTTVTYTITDGVGNTNTCAFTVTVSDNEAPTITCPANVNVNNDLGVCTAAVTGIAPTSSGDNCSVASISYTLTGATTGSGSNDASGETFNLGTTTVTYTITDGTGNTNTCSFTVTVIDNESPSITCPGNQMLSLDGTCNATLPDYTTGVGETDNCGVSSVTQSPAAGTSINAPTLVTITVTDNSGNTTNCSFTVNVEDTTNPIASCQNINVYLDGTGSATITTADIDNGSTDNCSTPALSMSQSSFNCADVSVSPINVTLTATDTAGNTNNCISQVTVLDTIKPNLTCPGNQMLSLDGTCNATLPDYTTGVGETDNCGVASVTQSPVAGTSINALTLVTVTVTDNSGNIRNCSFTVNVEDTTDPIASCQNINVYLDGTGSATITAADIDNGSTDNCSIPALSISQSSFNCADVAVSPINVTLTATDTAGNTDNCAAQVTVLDTVSPTALCQNITVYLDASGGVNIDETDVDVGSFDNCAVNELDIDIEDFFCSDLGTNVVTLSVEDESGNISTCQAQVQVVDTISPVASCQNMTVYLDGSGSASITANDIDNGSTDNCGIPSLSVSQSVFTCSNLSSSPVSVLLTATDNSGNSNNCSALVTVLDTISPTISCPANITQCDSIVNYSNPIISDNCVGPSLNLISGLSSGSDFPVGVTNVVYEVSDASGNISTCDFNVEVLPLINSDFILPDTLCLSIGIYDLETGVTLNNGETQQFYSTNGAQINANNFLQGNNSGPGYFEITHVVSNGFCSDTTVKNIELVATVQNGFDLGPFICSNLNQVNLNDYLDAGVSDTGYWSGPSVMQDSLWDLSGLDGVYALDYIIPQGQCSDTAMGSVLVHPDVDPSIDLIDSICESETVLLDNYILGDAGGVFTGPQVTNNVLNTTGLGSYVLISYEVGEIGCQEQDMDSIFVELKPNVFISVDTAICGDSIQFNPNYSGLSINWLNQANVTFASNNNPNSDIIFSNEGNYDLILEAFTQQCVNSDTVNVLVYFEPTIVDAGPDQNIAFTTSTSMNALPPDYGIGTWLNLSGLLIDDPSSETSLIDNLQIGDNELIWSVSNGVCPVSYDTVIILVKEIEIVSGFSPNNDGKNEYFHIEGLEHLGRVKLSVFSRWGKLVFEEEEYQNDWNGDGFNGSLPADTYYYIIESDLNKQYNGYIVIRR